MSNILDNIATKYKVKIKNCQKFNPNYNVKFSNYIKFREKYNFCIYKSDSINLFEYCIEKITVDYVFAINKIDTICMMKTRILGLNVQIPNVYVGNTSNKDSIIELFNDKEIANIINELNLLNNESIYLYKNILLFNSFRTDYENIINLLTRFMDHIPQRISHELEKEQVKFKSEFNSLLPLIEKWAISQCH